MSSSGTHRSHKIAQEKMKDAESHFTPKQVAALKRESGADNFSFNNLAGANVARVPGVPGIDFKETRAQAVAFHGTTGADGTLTPRSEALERADRSLDAGDYSSAFNHMQTAVRRHAK